MYFVLSQENKVDIGKIMSNHKCVCLYHWNLCGYCQMLMPMWNRLCKKYAKDTDVIIINIERSVMPLLKTKYKNNINGFPTIVKYEKGKRMQEYINKRTYKELNQFISS